MEDNSKAVIHRFLRMEVARRIEDANSGEAYGCRLTNPEGWRWYEIYVHESGGNADVSVGWGDVGRSYFKEIYRGHDSFRAVARIISRISKKGYVLVFYRRSFGELDQRYAFPEWPLNDDTW
jgi:hypothetical protein